MITKTKPGAPKTTHSPGAIGCTTEKTVNSKSTRPTFITTLPRFFLRHFHCLICSMSSSSSALLPVSGMDGGGGGGGDRGRSGGGGAFPATAADPPDSAGSAGSTPKRGANSEIEASGFHSPVGACNTASVATNSPVITSPLISSGAYCPSSLPSRLIDILFIKILLLH